MKDPRVSVLMPVYNAEPYVAQAVESILAQTFGDFEFLIFDDGSQDKSLTILERYANRDKRIRLFAKSHRGYVPWLNEGVCLSRGEFLARMDADDVSLTERFARQVDYLREHPACVVVGCGTLMIDSDGFPLHEHSPDCDHDTIFETLVNGGHGVIAHPTSMIRRTAMLHVGGYRDEYEPIEDFDLWFRLAEVGQLANIPEILFQYRQHHSSVMYTGQQVERQRRWADSILTEARRRLGKESLAHSCYSYYAPSVSGSHRMWATWALKARKRRTAIKHVWISLRADPWSPKSWVLFVACILPFRLLTSLNTCGFSRNWDKWNNFTA